MEAMLNRLDPGKRLLVYVAINVVVSALTALFVLALWTRFVLGGAPDFGGEVSNGSTNSTSQLVINTVIGASNLETEHVIIEHVGDEDVSLSGWRLRDESGAEYRFPALVIHPGAQISIYSGRGDDGAETLYWDRQIAVWSSGEKVSLLDSTAQVEATYMVP